MQGFVLCAEVPAKPFSFLPFYLYMIVHMFLWDAQLAQQVTCNIGLAGCETEMYMYVLLGSAC